MARIEDSEVKERFLNNVKNHTLEIVKDDGVYRVLRFANRKSYAYHFDINTWPGYLCISGDMGCYVFSRTHDMFTFFRSCGYVKDLKINPQYWGEKLKSFSGEHQVFDRDTFMENVKEYVERYFEDCREEENGPMNEKDQAFYDKVNAAIAERIEPSTYDGGVLAYSAAASFRVSEGDDEDMFNLYSYRSEKKTRSFTLYDLWEYDSREYTYDFLHCCYAVAWGIQQYDKQKAERFSYPISLTSV